MERADRERILNNMELLVDRFIEVNVDLLELCKSQKIISGRMKTNIEVFSMILLFKSHLFINKNFNL